MKHAEFIEKMERWSKHTGKTLDEVGKAEDCLTMVVINMLKFVDRHKNDPQVYWMGNESHKTVCELGSTIDLNSIESIRKALIDKFQRSTEGPIQNATKWTDLPLSKRLIKVLLNRSGLKWGELDGNPIVQWNERP